MSVKEHFCKGLVRFSLVTSPFLLLAGSKAFPSAPVNTEAAERKSSRSWAG